MKKVLIYYEQKQHKNSIELLAVARLIYGGTSADEEHTEAYETYGVSLEPTGSEANGLFDFLIQICGDSAQRERRALAPCQEHDQDNSPGCDALYMTSILAELQQEYQFDCILFPATHMGRMLAPRLAMRLQTGLVADVTDIRYKDGIMEIVRPAFSGKLMAGILSRTAPLMMSVRQNVFSYDPGRLTETRLISYTPKTASSEGLRLLKVREKEASKDIRDSDILISGGGGVMRDFKKLSDLAGELDALVSASRKTVDHGIAPRSIQVGQSGKTVSPKLYLALGINGSIQHIEGLKNVEYMIAVNTNKNAPICSISDIVVEGDAKEFINKLTEKIRKEKSKEARNEFAFQK
ncbi:electron transfer flavoprotein subunit alpha/FixB family protein [Anoxybacterium hadale]|uniref:Electron transfer flavoprotein subunit alpha/FixB family protein n=1 Tax=Anoxybacterium hadale TaxID=3408580 RepID=A0ACD1AE76_9FIRM|nr:electron transfer flavoprotein subunit alpha/FixB family protein [Clostridiales bacterium]